MSGMEAHRIFAVAEQAGAAQQPGMPGPSADRSGSHTSSGQRSADSPRLLREINDQVVLRLLLEHGQLTRGRIGELTGLSKPTVSSLLARLESRGLVTTTGVVEGGPGPNARIYAVHARAAHVVGVHVEQSGCFAGLATLTGELLATFSVPVRQRRVATPIGEISAAMDGLLAATGLTPDAVHRVVVATPGVIDPTTGRLRHARHIRGWETPGLIDELTETLAIRVIHGNDVNLAAVAERTHGVARDSSDYALLWLDRGVGLGLVLGGVLRAGAHGGAGEIGYLGVPGVDAQRADRGGTGGFQQLVGGQGLRSLARKYGLRGSDPTTIVRSALAAGDAGSGLITELATGIAVGAAAVTNLIDPGMLVLGGPVALAGGHSLLDRVVAHLHQISFVRPPVLLSGLSSADGVLQGAIDVALQSVRSQLFGQARAVGEGRVEHVSRLAERDRPRPQQGQSHPRHLDITFLSHFSQGWHGRRPLIRPFQPFPVGHPGAGPDGGPLRPDVDLLPPVRLALRSFAPDPGVSTDVRAVDVGTSLAWTKLLTPVTSVPGGRS